MEPVSGRRPGDEVFVPAGKELFMYRLTGGLVVMLCLAVTWTMDTSLAWRVILTAVAVFVLGAVLHLTDPAKKVSRFWYGLGIVAGLLAMAGIYLQPIDPSQKLIGWAILAYAMIRSIPAIKRKEG